MIHDVVGHPDRREWLAGFAAGLKFNSEWPSDVFVVRVDPDCPPNKVYILGEAGYEQEVTS